MGDFADDMKAMKEVAKKKKDAKIKYESEMIEVLSGELGFKYKIVQPWQIRLIHPATQKEFDYYPGSSKGSWVGTNKYKVYPDIEALLKQHFKSE